RNIVVSTQLRADIPAIRADRVQIQQVLLNLIINANDAMSDNAASERLLDITTRVLNEDHVEIAVCDRGHGVDDHDPEKIFQAFFTSKVHGLGLGLAICRSIVSAHQGQLQVRNNKYGGATFYLTLPIAHSEIMS
ncbi:MAG: ATP-binding protein, partial [Spongiibacteraceae bacterium]